MSASISSGGNAQTGWCANGDRMDKTERKRKMTPYWPFVLCMLGCLAPGAVFLWLAYDTSKLIDEIRDLNVRPTLLPTRRDKTTDPS